MGFIVYAVEDHLYSGVTVVEVGESVAGLTDTMIDEHVLDQYMQQIKPPAPVALEGDYTTWTLVWKRNYGAGTDGIMTNVRADNSGNVYATSISGIAYFKAYGGAEVSTAGYLWFIPGVETRERGGGGSATRRYIVGYDTDHTFDVWSAGVKIFTRDVQDDEASLWYCGPIDVSPNGKYIASGGSNGNGYLLLYEGS